MYKILVTAFLISRAYCNLGDCKTNHDCINYCAQVNPNTVSSECNEDDQCFCDPGTTTKMTTSTTTSASSSRNTVGTSTDASQTSPSTRSPMCHYFNSTRHLCKDNSACRLQHVLGVICPDPAEVIYCPQKCGCC
ncbi:uncharacterized protein LOC127867700 [Dreissena polymorpha]|uniref:C3H1-type domain-containing protein n=1 Tax=Dreissena polymorpha TaxID=45954 RepID=A0A9D4M2C8_DREPO|nr:uncharacterized protein LOC127867700 [Dreissena polymorpha]KAH3868074.1 hypothetical protein DPMN_031211 [Dreissena polymorpha]